MANINTPITAAETNTQAEDTVKNPTTAVGGNAQCGENVYITLRFTGGRTIDPNEIYDMVNEKYGTVASLKASLARGAYIFNIEE